MALKFDPTAVLDNVQEEDLAPRRRNTEVTVDLSPWKKLIQESYESGKGKVLRVPAEQVKDVSRVLRNAAKDLSEEGIGVSLQFSWEGQEPFGTWNTDKHYPENDDVEVKVGFKGRKARAPRAEKAKNGEETDPETEDETEQESDDQAAQSA